MTRYVVKEEIKDISRKIFKEVFSKLTLKYIIGLPKEKYDNILKI